MPGTCVSRGKWLSGYSECPRCGRKGVRGDDSWPMVPRLVCRYCGSYKVLGHNEWYTGPGIRDPEKMRGIRRRRGEET
jgi:hypothetical protein